MILIDNTDDMAISFPDTQEEYQCIMNLILENGEFSKGLYSWDDLEFMITKDSFVSFEEEEIFKNLFLDSLNPIFYLDARISAYIAVRKNLKSLAWFVYYCLESDNYKISLNKHMASRKVWDWVLWGLTYHPDRFIPNVFFDNVRKLENLMDSAE